MQKRLRYSPIVINSSNLDPGTNQNTYRYAFPGGSVRFDHARVAVASVALPYSWQNISSAFGNTSYTITWPIGAGTSSYTLTMPSGFYDVSTLNTYLQSYLVSQSLYLIDSSGNYVYYVQWQENATRYAVQLNSFPVPTSLPTGWSAPASWPGYPSSTLTPQITIGAAFGTIVGFAVGTYPAVAQATTYSALSSSTPQVSQVTSVIITSSLIANRLCLPNTVLYSFVPDVAYGSIINAVPPALQFVDVQNGSYVNFTVSFVDQDLNPITILDTQILLTLLIEQEV